MALGSIRPVRSVVNSFPSPLTMASPSEPTVPASYCSSLQTDLTTHVGAAPRAVVHASEWAKVIAGEPVEINPSIGHGFKVMTVDEYTALWKRNDDFPDCLACGGMNTKEHHFVQTWCRGLRRWESETLCLDCHMFSWRSYADPDFATPEEHEKALWESMLIEQAEKNRVEGRA